MVSEELYQLRRRVMNHLYRARELSGECMPWVRVRIVPLGKNVLGQTQIGITRNNEMKISEDMKTWDDLRLKEVVFHELGHKYLGARHSKDKTNLMAPVIAQNISSEKIECDFINLAKKNKKCVVDKDMLNCRRAYG